MAQGPYDFYGELEFLEDYSNIPNTSQCDRKLFSFYLNNSLSKALYGTSLALLETQQDPDSSNQTRVKAILSSIDADKSDRHGKADGAG